MRAIVFFVLGGISKTIIDYFRQSDVEDLYPDKEPTKYFNFTSVDKGIYKNVLAIDKFYANNNIASNVINNMMKQALIKYKNKMKTIRDKKESMDIESLRALLEEPDADVVYIQRRLKQPQLFIFEFTDNGNTEELVISLTNFVTLIIETGIPGMDRVLIKLYSPGGAVDEYGLAAMQLMRLRRASFFLTIAVDKIAASGGYMMACIGHTIIASEFATIGSIGVVAEIFNCSKLLEQFNIEHKYFTAGEDKVTASQYSKLAPEADQKLNKQIENIHSIFKQHVLLYRPYVNIDVVGTGKTWLASDAIDHQLVDILMTSDEFISNMIDQGMLAVNVFRKIEKTPSFNILSLFFNQRIQSIFSVLTHAFVKIK